ncbi:MAG: aminotransferase class I/II-fold pyridoxal phosphate-dependent enzyme [Planctomycetota bacterium]|jgi:aspartate/methionine/tyrosine aminotransferase
MAKGLEEWVEYILETPGERHDISGIARYHPNLNEIIGDIDMQRSMFWSGKLHGIPEVLDNIIKTQQYDASHEHVMPICGGTTMGLFLACTALLKPGDEVVCETPGWPQVGRICGRMGVEVKWWRLRSEDGWKPDCGELKKLVNGKTRLIYINHPHNPTGVSIPDSEMKEICNVASKHGAYVLSDEINRGLEWNGGISPSAVNLYERGFTASSLSKRFGATGIRYGWFVTKDKELYRKCFDIYYDSLLCNNHPAEIIAARLLEPKTYKKILDESMAIGEENLAFLSALVGKNDMLSMTRPEGSYSCFLNYHTGEPSWDFFERMMHRKPEALEFIPGSCFGEPCEYHIRIGFGHRPAQFKEALRVLEEGLNEYRR